MAKLDRKQIQARARRIPEDHPQGIRWMELLRAVEAQPGTEGTLHNSVHGAVHSLLVTDTDEIVKVARGTYRLAKHVAADGALAAEQDT